MFVLVFGNSIKNSGINDRFSSFYSKETQTRDHFSEKFVHIVPKFLLKIEIIVRVAHENS
jgi:hypothetical protein